MTKHKNNKEDQDIKEEVDNSNVEASASENGSGEQKEEKDGASVQETELERLKVELSEAKDKYLRLYSEFENFRRRSAKERLELIQTANQDLLVDLLPVLDDFERAANNYNEKTEVSTLKEGMDLIFSKFFKVLEQKGVKPMEKKEGMDFNPDIHEAITQIPAPKDDLKGKVVDVVEKGYYLNDKVIRFAKVVIGS